VTALAGREVKTGGRRSRRRRLVRLGILFLGLAAVSQVVWWTEPAALFGVLEWAAPGVVWRVRTNEPIIALSFDDGPDPTYTPQVLDILAQHEAHATFFLIGHRAMERPDLVAAIKEGGHEVGNHYLQRGTSLSDSREVFAEKLGRAERIIGSREALKLFRPPGGLAWPEQLEEARQQGYTCVLGSAYPHDPSRPPVDYIEWLVEKNMVPGAIVILHDGIADPSRSIEALPSILSEGQRRGLRFVTVGELIKSRPRP
jgi:peptidoglycan/xylan/chitin deacetylase (PgdA/CDA1 family)